MSSIEQQIATSLERIARALDEIVRFCKEEQMKLDKELGRTTEKM